MGAWIEILVALKNGTNRQSRTPRWVRGLKSDVGSTACCSNRSHPTMGAWIEIDGDHFDDGQLIVAPHDGCVD